MDKMDKGSLMKDASIIGAGPIGCYLAGLLRDIGYSVHIYEEHDEIGKPVSCTGIITKAISDLVKLKKDIIVNKIKYAEIFSPINSIKIKINDIVLDRHKFDNYMAEMAVQKGAVIHLNNRFIGLINGSIILKDLRRNSNIKKKSSCLIGCDGPFSKVAEIINPKTAYSNTHQYSNTSKKTKKTDYIYYIGKQAIVKGSFEKDTFKVYVGSICPNFFGWIVPENEEFARVGIAALEKPNKVFSNFLKKINVDMKDIAELQGGLIPLFDKRYRTSIIKDDVKVYVAGDAARQVKASTGGGLVPGMRAANALARSLANKTSYDEELKAVNRELRVHLGIRKILNEFKDADYDKLIGYLNKKSIQDAFEKIDRDSSIKLMLHILLKEPRILGFFGKVGLKKLLY